MIAGPHPTAEAEEQTLGAEEQSLGAEKPPLGADKPSLGLRRLAVQLVEHQREWMLLADDACDEIRSASGGLLIDVQHSVHQDIESIENALKNT